MSKTRLPNEIRVISAEEAIGIMSVKMDERFAVVQMIQAEQTSSKKIDFHHISFIMDQLASPETVRPNDLTLPDKHASQLKNPHGKSILRHPVTGICIYREKATYTGPKTHTKKFSCSLWGPFLRPYQVDNYVGFIYDYRGCRFNGYNSDRVLIYKKNAFTWRRFWLNGQPGYDAPQVSSDACLDSKFILSEKSIDDLKKYVESEEKTHKRGPLPHTEIKIRAHKNALRGVFATANNEHSRLVAYAIKVKFVFYQLNIDCPVFVIDQAEIQAGRKALPVEIDDTILEKDLRSALDGEKKAKAATVNGNLARLIAPFLFLNRPSVWRNLVKDEACPCYPADGFHVGLHNACFGSTRPDDFQNILTSLEKYKDYNAVQAFFLTRPHADPLAFIEKFSQYDKTCNITSQLRQKLFPLSESVIDDVKVVNEYPSPELSKLFSKLVEEKKYALATKLFNNISPQNCDFKYDDKTFFIMYQFFVNERRYDLVTLLLNRQRLNLPTTFATLSLCSAIKNKNDALVKIWLDHGTNPCEEFTEGMKNNRTRKISALALSTKRPSTEKYFHQMLQTKMSLPHKQAQKFLKTFKKMKRDDLALSLLTAENHPASSIHFLEALASSFDTFSESTLRNFFSKNALSNFPPRNAGIALCYLLLSNCYNFALLLLRAHVHLDLTVKDAKNQTALLLAIASDHREMIDLLFQPTLDQLNFSENCANELTSTLTAYIERPNPNPRWLTKLCAQGANATSVLHDAYKQKNQSLVVYCALLPHVKGNIIDQKTLENIMDISFKHALRSDDAREVQKIALEDTIRKLGFTTNLLQEKEKAQQEKCKRAAKYIEQFVNQACSIAEIIHLARILELNQFVIDTLTFSLEKKNGDNYVSDVWIEITFSMKTRIVNLILQTIERSYNNDDTESIDKIMRSSLTDRIACKSSIDKRKRDNYDARNTQLIKDYEKALQQRQLAKRSAATSSTFINNSSAATGNGPGSLAIAATPISPTQIRPQSRA